MKFYSHYSWEGDGPSSRRSVKYTPSTDKDRHNHLVISGKLMSKWCFWPERQSQTLCFEMFCLKWKQKWMKTQCVKHNLTTGCKFLFLACSLSFLPPVLVVHREVHFNLSPSWIREQRGGCVMMQWVLGSRECFPERPWRCMAQSAEEAYSKVLHQVKRKTKPITQNIKLPATEWQNTTEQTNTFSASNKNHC